MSHEGSTKGGSNSESSSSSPNQVVFFQDTKELTDLTLFGSPAPTLYRTGTVRRASAGSKKETNTEEVESSSSSVKEEKIEQALTDRYRRSLDCSYRHSLESIFEYKTTKSSISTTSLFPSRECSSMDSSSSDCTDYAMRSCSESNRPEKTIMSPSSSYLSWIESVNSEYFGSAVSTNEAQDVDNKVGEWNNFWLNYNNARGKYISSPLLNTISTEDKTGDEMSEPKSSCSTQREFDKNSTDYVTLTLDEINETVKCSQRILEIMQNALRRIDRDFEDSNDSYYSQSLSQQVSEREIAYEKLVKWNSMAKDEPPVQRERSFSYAVDAHDLQRQKQGLKQTTQSSSTSCINALLNTGVADILKRVINKRRDVMTPDDQPSITRSSFSEWSSAK